MRWENKEFKQVTTCLVLILGRSSSHMKGNVEQSELEERGAVPTTGPLGVLRGEMWES